MNSALNGSAALQRFEHGNTVEIRNRIIFDFYPQLPHICLHTILGLSKWFEEEQYESQFCEVVLCGAGYINTYIMSPRSG